MRDGQGREGYDTNHDTVIRGLLFVPLPTLSRAHSRPASHKSGSKTVRSYTAAATLQERVVSTNGGERG
jgi:hypothetical protein